MALVLTITSQGRDDLAEAISAQDSLTISNIVLTNATTTGTLANVSTTADLGGSIVSTMSASGRRLDTGKVQVEGSDNTTASYEAKTMALTYTKSSETRVFALYTDASTFIFKSSDTAVMIAAAIAIDDAQAQSITFDNLSIQFPPASSSARGTVKLATGSQIETPPAVDASNPIVVTAQVLADEMHKAIGSDSLNGHRIDVKKDLTVGKTTWEVKSYATSSFTLSSEVYKTAYIQPGSSASSPDIATLTDGGFWEFSDGYEGTFSEGYYVVGDIQTNGHSLKLVDESKNVIGQIIYNAGAYEISLLSDPATHGSYFSINARPTASVAKVHALNADSIDVTRMDAQRIASGVTKTIQFTADDFSLSDSTYTLNKLVDAELVNGVEYYIPYLTVTHLLTGAYANNQRTWTRNGRTYTLSYLSHTFTCTGGVPEAGSLIYTETGKVEVSGRVSVNGLDLTRGAALGVAKCTLSSSGITSIGLYNLNLRQESGYLVITYSGPKLLSSYSSMLFDVTSDAKLFGGNTQSSTVAVAATSTSSGWIGQVQCSLPSGLSSAKIIVKAY